MEYLFCNIQLIIACCVGDCPIVLLYILEKSYSGKPDFLIL